MSAPRYRFSPGRGVQAKVVRVDEHGRVMLPRSVREALGLREGSKLLVVLGRGDSIELIPLEKLYERVSEAFRKKMRGWREESHEASKLLEKLVHQ